MVCTEFIDIKGISDFLVWPTLCYYYFYLVIGISLIMILTWILIKADEDKGVKGDFISASAVSSIAVLTIMSFGTLVTNNEGIPMIQLVVLLYFVAIATSLTIIWIFKD